MKVKQINDRTVHVQVPHVGHVELHKFGSDFDHGLYRDRLWHVTTFGRNFATVQECVAFLQAVADGWDDAASSSADSRPVSHAEMTHSFQATEASLDATPY